MLSLEGVCASENVSRSSFLFLQDHSFVEEMKFRSFFFPIKSSDPQMEFEPCRDVFWALKIARGFRILILGYTPVIQHSNGNSPFPIGNSFTNGGFSIAMLVYRSVTVFQFFFGFFLPEKNDLFIAVFLN